MAGSAARIAKILLDARVVSPAQLDAARAQTHAGGPPLLQVVAELGFAREEAIADAIALAYKLTRVGLATFKVDPAALALLDAAFCEERNLFPCVLRDEGQTLWIAVSDPSDQESAAAAATLAGVRSVRLVVAGHDEIQQALLRSYRGESFRPAPSSATGTIDEAAHAAAAHEEEARAAAKIAAAEVAAAAAPAAVYEVEVIDQPPPRPGRAPAPHAGLEAAQHDLEDLLGISAQGGLTADEQGRLEMLLESHARSSKALRAVVELCMERGLFVLDEYRDKFR